MHYLFLKNACCYRDNYVSAKSIIMEPAPKNFYFPNFRICRPGKVINFQVVVRKNPTFLSAYNIDIVGKIFFTLRIGKSFTREMAGFTVQRADEGQPLLLSQSYLCVQILRDLNLIQKDNLWVWSVKHCVLALIRYNSTFSFSFIFPLAL